MSNTRPSTSFFKTSQNTTLNNLLNVCIIQNYNLLYELNSSNFNSIGASSVLLFCIFYNCDNIQFTLFIANCFLFFLLSSPLLITQHKSQKKILKQSEHFFHRNYEIVTGVTPFAWMSLREKRDHKSTKTHTNLVWLTNVWDFKCLKIQLKFFNSKSECLWTSWLCAHSLKYVIHHQRDYIYNVLKFWKSWIV